MAYNLNNLFPKPTYSSSALVADQRLTVDDTSGGKQFATTFNGSTNMVMFDVQGADVMCTVDGSAPTSTNGHRLYQGTTYTWSAAMAQTAKFIRQGATNATIHASELQL